MGNSVNSSRFRKGGIPWNKGIPFSEKVKEKMSKSQKRKILTKEHKKNISIATKGKRRKPLTEEHKKKISLNNVKGIIGMKGKHHSQETKDKLSKMFKGRIISLKQKKQISQTLKKRYSNAEIVSWMKGKTCSEEVIKKIKESRAKQIFPLKDTSIEVKVQNFLKKLGVEFFTHQTMDIEHRYQCDIFIPSMNLVIECDGDYWHKYPIGNDLDHIRTKELIEGGFKVLRLWENEINELTINDFKKCLV